VPEQKGQRDVARTAESGQPSPDEVAGYFGKYDLDDDNFMPGQLDPSDWHEPKDRRTLDTSHVEIIPHAERVEGGPMYRPVNPDLQS
jgi:hypothetical protein